MQKYILSLLFFLFPLFLLAQDLCPFTVSYDQKTSLCNSIEKNRTSKAIPNIEMAESAFYIFFESIKSITRIAPTKENLKIKKYTIDAQNIVHVRAQQYLNGLPVYGAEITYHLTPIKERVLGSLYPPQKAFPTLAKISENTAKKLALQNVLANKKEQGSNIAARAIVNGMYYYPIENNDLVLVYELALNFDNYEQWLVYVDAVSGKIRQAHTSSFHIIDKSGFDTIANAYDIYGTLRKINVYKERDTFYMMNIIENMFVRDSFTGAIEVIDAKCMTVTDPLAEDPNRNIVRSIDNQWKTDSIAVSVAYNLTEINRFYAQLLGLNSFDNKGSTLKVFINGGTLDGKGWDNSCWTSSDYMVLGAGDVSFHNFARSKDVTAHEYGHAIVMNSTNLTYNGESGAIHEGFADMFAYTADQKNWRIGEDAIKDTVRYPSGALRDMSNPSNGSEEGRPAWQPKHIREVGVGKGVSTDVHVNSGIPNYMFYHYANEISAEKALKIMHKALIDYMNVSTGFILFRKAVVAAATDLYGENSLEALAADRSFAKVGIYKDSIDEGLTSIDQIYNANSMLLDSVLLVKGVIMAVDAKGCYLQDANTPWSGIYIQDSIHKYTAKMKIKIRGSLDTLEQNRFLKPNWSGQHFPGNTYKAVGLKIEELTAAYVNMYVFLENLKCDTLANDAGIWVLKQDGKSLLISSEIFKFTLKQDFSYTIKGILTYTQGQYVLLPREKNDIQILSSNESMQNLSSFVMYPNPASQYISLKGSNASDIHIYNTMGQEVLYVNANNQNGNVQIDISSLPKGLYIVEVKDRKQIRTQLKMIKQ
ncbi:MAG: M4 family metallopeptidase [Bacteroidales bacterium]